MAPITDKRLARDYRGTVHIKEDEAVIAIVDRLAKKDGLVFSNLIRKAIRSYLATRDDLTSQERQTLGLEPAVTIAAEKRVR